MDQVTESGVDRVAKLIARDGPDAKLVEHKGEITANCLRPANAAISTDQCGAYFPDLIRLLL